MDIVPDKSNVMCTWIFDSLLLAGVAILVHYCLVQYIDNKEPLPGPLQEIVDFLKGWTKSIQQEKESRRLHKTSELFNERSFWKGIKSRKYYLGLDFIL